MVLKLNQCILTFKGSIPAIQTVRNEAYQIIAVTNQEVSTSALNPVYEHVQ